MNIAPLLQALGYRESRNFILSTKGDDLPASELSFALRHIGQACEELSIETGSCRFHGAYALQEKPGAPALPVVYVFETELDSTAKEIHRLVWNQNLVPFVVIASSSTIRVYPGFAYSHDEDKSLLSVPAETASVLGQLAAFSATAIDDGVVWREWGHAADPAGRADESLLRDLMALDGRLQEEGLDRVASHGLIGKFVYLRYLRDRDILSDRKLVKWEIAPDDVFSRNATLKGFRALNTQLQDWLNGSVFRLGDEALANVSQAQLRLVAGVFCGDSPAGQMHLDFRAYDFSHIPIETLSCVYEQFLHDTEDSDGQTRGKTLGAYYTPIPLADYLVSELERKRPLKEGMKVLDPSCGSGVFLVQCYRRLIEKKMRSEKRRLKTSELRTLLTDHIFGIDRDDDACRVAELSLILTLLDYVNPPDLENTPFKLPSLRGANIFREDFFDANGDWHQRFSETQFDWLVGNPPWAEVKGEPAPEHDHFPVWKWMTDHKTSHPTGGNQIAEAFLWRTSSHLTTTGVAGLLVPAMTWFKKESVGFRREFFAQRQIWCLANFANLAYVLFAGRAESPASAVFFQSKTPSDDHSIITFAPFVAEQVANRPQKANKRSVTWNIVVNGSEMREVQNNVASAGHGLTWKLAMWGSTKDSRLLARVCQKACRFDYFCSEHSLNAHQGFEVRPCSSEASAEVERRDDLVGKKKALFTKLKGVRRVFSLPPEAVGRITRTEAFVRKRGGFAGLDVSEPPHILVDASRRFALFLDEFVAVPSRQVGVAGPENKAKLLRALSLYLSSDFCTYHQFFASPQWGVDMNRADLEALKELPVPLPQLSASEMDEWCELQRELASLSAKRVTTVLWSHSDEDRFNALLAEINSRVFKLLGLRTTERWLVEDFVRLNLELNKGKVTHEAMRRPTHEEVGLYLATLRDCLDGFLTASRGFRHRIEAISGTESALISISLQQSTTPIPARMLAADQAEARTLLTLRDRLRQKHSQWLYFDRALKIYDRRQGVLCQFKPLQRLHWTRRQAVLDADEIIAETLTEGGDS